MNLFNLVYNNVSSNGYRIFIWNCNLKDNFSQTFGSTQNSMQHQNFIKDPNYIKYRQCFKNSLRELDNLLKELGSNGKPTIPLNNANSANPLSSREDRIHGYLLIILEIVKFAGLEFEQQLEKYSSKYNLYHQQQSQGAANVHYPNNFEVGHTGSPMPVNASQTNAANLNTANSSIIENTARSCEEMHASNLLKLLPHSCFDPLHANDPFIFLFKSDKITVNIESRTCSLMIIDKFDSIVGVCLNTIRCLNLANVAYQAPSGLSSANSQTNISFRCIQETVMALLPRLARFDQKKFTANYLKDILSFLTTLNNNTAFLSATNNANAATTAQANSSNQTNNTSILTGFEYYLIWQILRMHNFEDIKDQSIIWIMSFDFISKS